MKYIIDVPDSFVDITNGLHIPMDKQGAFKIDTGLKLTPYTESDEVKNNKVNLCDSCNYIYPECPSEKYDVMFGDGVGKDNICCCAGYRAINEQEIRQKVEDEVWEFARNLLNYTDVDWDAIERMLLIDKCTYQDAKAKYEAWMKQKDKIHVGDEVYHKELPELKIYVTDMDDNSFGGFALCKMGNFCDYGDRFSECDVHQYKPTGRMLPNIVQLLNKMQEE